MQPVCPRGIRRGRWPGLAAVALVAVLAGCGFLSGAQRGGVDAATGLPAAPTGGADELSGYMLAYVAGRLLLADGADLAGKIKGKLNGKAHAP